MVYSITVSKLIEKMNLKNYTPEIDTRQSADSGPGYEPTGGTVRRIL